MGFFLESALIARQWLLLNKVRADVTDQNATDEAHAGVQKCVYLPSGGERYLATVLGANHATVHWTWWGALILLHLGRVLWIALPTAR